MHLGHYEMLKERPGRGAYETTAMNFIVSSMMSSFNQGLLNNEEKNTSFWQSVLTHENVSVQTISWKRVFSIVEKTKHQKLLHQAIFIALNAQLIIEPIDNDQVQDAIYDFLYATLSDLMHQVINTKTKSEIINQFCTMIAKMLNTHMQGKYFYSRGCFIKLLCKTYVCSSQFSKVHQYYVYIIHHIYYYFILLS